MCQEQRALAFPFIQVVVVVVPFDEPLRGLVVVVSVRETVARRWIHGGKPLAIALYFCI